MLDSHKLPSMSTSTTTEIDSFVARLLDGQPHTQRDESFLRQIAERVDSRTRFTFCDVVTKRKLKTMGTRVALKQLGSGLSDFPLRGTL